MDAKTAETLTKITSNFYQGHYASFSETRARPWSGWETCLPYIQDAFAGARQSFSVFDLACGNLRFEEFLKESFPDHGIDFYAVDNCEYLVPKDFQLHFQNLDVISALQQALPLGKQLTAAACDLSVSFGFLHHIPLQEHRREVMENLLEKTCPGGLSIVTLWQFQKNAAMEEKADAVNKRALKELQLPELDKNDYLLGWKNIPGVYRYCHSFSEKEIDQLVESVASKASLVARFSADGRTENLNSYLILKAKG